jgi:hypothetical protein
MSEQQGSLRAQKGNGVFHRTVLRLAGLLLLGGPLSAQVVAEHVEPSAAPAPTEVKSPMRLTIPLAGDERRGAVVDLEVNHSRRFTDTAQFIVDRMQVTEVRVGKRLGRKKQEELLITAYLVTEWFRQKVDVSLALVGSGHEAWSWKDRIVLGMKAGDVIGGGGLGIANSSKGQKLEVSVPITLELRQALASEPSLQIVVSIVE